MALTADEICCLKLKVNSCIAAVGYEIVRKCNKGYDVDDLFEKLAYLSSLESLLLSGNQGETMTLINNEIHFCDEKVLLSKNNSLFLTNVEDECAETELTEICCIDLCEVEAKISSICINC